MRVILKIIVELIVGAGLLAFGAERFITASAALARHLKIPSLVIGIILVGFGTSFPELIVSAIAAFHGKTQISIGNVVGSNIANIGLILGVVALIIPIEVHSRLVKWELPALIIISFVIGAFLWNGYLSRPEGIILILLLILHLYWMSITSLKKKVRSVARITPRKITDVCEKSVIWWFLGLALLFISSELLVDGAVGAAQLLGISDLVIGLTIVTVCTSLPEFAATLMGVLKKEHDIAIGHIIGSNIFNSLAVLAMPALIAPGRFPSSVMRRDYPAMMIFTIGLWLFTILTSRRGGGIGRVFGIIFLLGYISYVVLLFISST